MPEPAERRCGTCRCFDPDRGCAPDAIVTGLCRAGPPLPVAEPSGARCLSLWATVSATDWCWGEWSPREEAKVAGLPAQKTTVMGMDPPPVVRSTEESPDAH